MIERELIFLRLYIGVTVRAVKNQAIGQAILAAVDNLKET
jgi:hypothetical protein